MPFLFFCSSVSTSHAEASRIAEVCRSHEKAGVVVIDMTEPKLSMLQGFFDQHGDYKLHRMADAHTPVWAMWHWYTALNDSMRERANLRSLFDDELVLDIEDPTQVDKIKAMLLQNSYNFSLWATGSRGYHFHLIFPELAKVTEAERKAYRQYFIKQTDSCPSKQSGLIALENTEHFKTGNLKTKVFEISSDIPNKLPPKNIVELLMKPKFEGNPVQFNKKIEDFLDMTQFRRTGRNEYIGKHPYHGATTGHNFSINVEKQIWHCFHHHCGGNILHLLAMREGIINCGDKIE